MEGLFAIIVAAALVNNLVLVQFLGLCPLIGTSRQVESAAGMALATAFVLTTASALGHVVQVWILEPMDLEYLRLLAFMLIIAGAVQATEITVRAVSPVLHAALGIYLPLITSNCAVLGVVLLNTYSGRSFAEAVFYGAGSSLGFGLVLVLLAALRERLDSATLPKTLKGVPATLIAAGIACMAFMGFSGLGS